MFPVRKNSHISPAFAQRSIVEQYTFHRDAYLHGQEKYNQTQLLRQDFIDPFFTALGGT